MDCVISYNTYKKKANKYLIDYCTNGGKKITYNKLRHKINDFENKKHNVSQKQKMYNNIKLYLEGDIDDDKLNKAIYYYIGK